MFGERDMGNGTASAVAKTCRKSGQFIFPNVWLHIPTGKKKSTPHKKNKENNNTDKKKPWASLLLRRLQSLYFYQWVEVSHAQQTLCKASGWKQAARHRRACSSWSYISLPYTWVFLLLIKLQNSTNYAEDFQQLLLINHNCLLYLKAVAFCFGNKVSIRCQGIFKTTPYVRLLLAVQY